MYKKGMIMTVMMAVCFMTACTQKPDSEERGGIRVAVGDGEYQESRSEDAKPASDDKSAPDSSFPENDSTESPGHSSDREVSEILAACAGTRIEQTIETAEGISILISADVNVEGITRVSRYEYVLTDITEEIRAGLFRSAFPDTADQAEYDEMNDVWTLDIDPAVRNYFLYQISYSNGGTTIPGEQIIMFENRYFDLYPFEDNRLGAVSDSRAAVSAEEAAEACRRIVDAVADTDFEVDYIHAYGTGGRRPYYKIVFKRMLDGMPVTTYNNLSFLYDNDGLEKVWGSLFSSEEMGLESLILTVEEAVEALERQASYLDFGEEEQISVSEIAPEYLTLMSPTGDILIMPVWRFRLGKDADERNYLREKILAINAVTGDIIWEERGSTF